ncbi:MAG: 5-oxoproline transporter, DUF969 family subunit [Acidobacteriota bacterium]
MELPDLLKLSGIGLVVIGMRRGWRTTVVVVAAALVTGLAAGLPLFTAEGVWKPLVGELPGWVTRSGKAGIIDLLGKAFADNRLMTLFILTLPAIGLAERYGLQEEAGRLIRRVRAATVGRLLLVYQGFRILHGALGIRLNGHPSFVRPLISPMAIGAAGLETSQKDAAERIRAATAAAENYGNFYGQNLSPVQAGVLLVFGVMQGLGVAVSVWDLVRHTLPIVSASVLLAIVQFWWLDRRLRRTGGSN